MPKTKDQKRLEAELRQAARDRRSKKEQLALIKERPGKSEKERRRLGETV